MIKMMIALRRKAHLSRPQFLTYWADVHAPRVWGVSDLLGIRKYVQCHAAREEGRGSDGFAAMVVGQDCDGVAEIWFDSHEAHGAGRNDPAVRAAMRRIRNDEDNFIDRARSIVWWGVERSFL